MKHSKIPLLTTICVLVFFYLPLFVLAVNSFNDSSYGGSWNGFTFKWYEKLWQKREIWESLEKSLIIGLGATVISMLLGTTAAFALHRYASKLQFFHYTLIYTPMVVPEILMGMSLLLFFSALGINLSLWTIFVAHVTFCIGYVALVVLGHLQEFDFSILEAAMDLGANWWTAIWKVLIPLLAPGIVAGGLLAFTLSIDDFMVTFLVAGPGCDTLPLAIYSMMRKGEPAIINALSVILLIVTFMIVFASQRLQTKTSK